MSASTTQWKTRRLGARAIKVYHRHSGVSGSIAAYGGSLVPSAEAYIAAYDAATRYRASWRIEMDEGKGAMKALESAIKAWLPHIARELPGIDISTLADRPTVPEDLIEDGIRASEALGEIKAADGSVPAWASAGSAEVLAKSQAAEKETDEAADADAKLSDLLATVRKNGAALQADLTLFRQTLRAVLGRSHPDFQKLRAEKATAKDEDDDPNAPQPAPPVTPAPHPPA